MRDLCIITAKVFWHLCHFFNYTQIIVFFFFLDIKMYIFSPVHTYKCHTVTVCQTVASRWRPVTTTDTCLWQLNDYF